MHLREEGYALLPTEISDQPGGVFDQGGILMQVAFGRV